jgi:AcrR family transcriptional regulator
MVATVRIRKLRKPQERAAVTRSLLLSAAEQVFARVGYEKASAKGLYTLISRVKKSCF